MSSFPESDAKRNILDDPRANIVSVVELLGGTVRRYRCQAFWRDGDGWNVSLNVSQGLFFDHVAGVGGGVLDLIVQVRGGSRSDAMNWLKRELGFAVSNSKPPKPLSAEVLSDADRVIDWRAGREQQLERMKANARNDAELEPAARELYLLQQSKPGEWFHLCAEHWLDCPEQALQAEELGREERGFVEGLEDLIRRNS